MIDISEQPPSDEIRAHSEGALARRTRASDERDHDLPRLVHELQLRQIELEIENEALRQSQAKTQATLSCSAEVNSRLIDEVMARCAALERSSTRATQIIEASADGLYGIDAHGAITFINSAACDLLGVSAKKVIGQSAHRLFHSKRSDGSDYPEAQCPATEALKMGTTTRIDNEVFWHADGHAVPVMYAVHPLGTVGSGEGSVVSVVNMTKHREVAAAQTKALIAAENLARLRSEFLANTSHEIRTPLTCIMGFAEIGVRDYSDSEGALSAFQIILKSSQHMLGVVNDVLDFAKIEAGQLSLEVISVSIIEIIWQSIASVEPLIRAKNLAFAVDISPSVDSSFFGDPLRIQQVLLNLLSNAVKFTELGSISMKSHRDAQHIVFRINDTGIGINELQIGNLFQPFYQLDGSSARKVGGTGLGLAIVKRLVDQMGGSIEVESVPSVGSTFTVRIPCAHGTSGAMGQA